MNPPGYTLIKCLSPAELAGNAASRLLARLGQRAPSDQPFIIALSGGRIAHDFFAALTAQARNYQFIFDRVHFFWGDERCVPPEDAESNFAAANQLLFQPLKIPGAQIHRILGELPDAAEAARLAEVELRAFTTADAASVPVMDLVLLGMGEDGHVASLFPGESAEAANSPAIYRPVIGPKPPPRRITLGYNPLAIAREVWLLASSAGKAAAFKASLAPGGKTPLARVLRERKNTIIFSDILS